MEAQYSSEGVEKEYTTNSTRLTFNEESDKEVHVRRMFGLNLCYAYIIYFQLCPVL